MEFTTITAAITATKTLTDLITSLRSEVSPQAHNQIQDLVAKALEIQAALLHAQQREFEFTQRCRELEGELDRLKDWETYRARYVLKDIGRGAYVFALRPECIESESADARHWLCSLCLEDGKKSYLHEWEDGAWHCQRCKSMIYGTEGQHP